MPRTATNTALRRQESDEDSDEDSDENSDEDSDDPVCELEGSSDEDAAPESTAPFSDGRQHVRNGRQRGLNAAVPRELNVTASSMTLAASDTFSEQFRATPQPSARKAPSNLAGHGAIMGASVGQRPAMPHAVGGFAGWGGVPICSHGPLEEGEARTAAADEILVPSATGGTGFKGVTKRQGRVARPYEAQIWVKGSICRLGSFATATEAALCCTRYIGPEQAAIAAANAKIGLPRALTAEEARTAAEREGLELLLSTTNGTGFKYVTKRPRRLSHPYEAYVCEKGSNRTLGSFATATEAALCYARYTAPAASGQQGEPNGPNAASPEKPAKRRRGDGRGALDGSVAPTIDVGQAPKRAVALPPIMGVTGLHLSSTVSAEQQNLNVLPHPPPQPRPPPPLPRFPPPLPLKSAAAPLGSPTAELTMAQKVARIKEEHSQNHKITKSQNHRKITKSPPSPPFPLPLRMHTGTFRNSH